jgi:hypothetical protein
MKGRTEICEERKRHERRNKLAKGGKLKKRKGKKKGNIKLKEQNSR